MGNSAPRAGLAMCCVGSGKTQLTCSPVDPTICIDDHHLITFLCLIQDVISCNVKSVFYISNAHAAGPLWCYGLPCRLSSFLFFSAEGNVLITVFSSCVIFSCFQSPSQITAPKVLMTCWNCTLPFPPITLAIAFSFKRSSHTHLGSLTSVITCRNGTEVQTPEIDSCVYSGSFHSVQKRCADKGITDRPRHRQEWGCEARWAI